MTTLIHAKDLYFVHDKHDVTLEYFVFTSKMYYSQNDIVRDLQQVARAFAKEKLGKVTHDWTEIYQNGFGEDAYATTLNGEQYEIVPFSKYPRNVLSLYMKEADHFVDGAVNRMLSTDTKDNVIYFPFAK